MKILLTGSSGFIGSSLTAYFAERGHEVIKLVRKSGNLAPDERFWDPVNGKIYAEDLEVDAVVNLAGENIAGGRWTEERKKRLLDSRVKSTELLCQAISQLKQPPNVLVSASAIGYYGDQGDSILDETAKKGSGFLAEVCEKWEAATDILKRKVRVVNLRIGVVLSPKGGALPTMLFPFKWGLGGTFGSGKQYMSWIALEDLLAVIEFAVQQGTLNGPVNAVSPEPVTNEFLTEVLGRVLHRPTLFSVPGVALRALLGQMADEMLLLSARVVPISLQKAGFAFRYPDIESYLMQCTDL